ncbi:hypothetical protein [Pseudoduganella sp.]|uniref:hypothetical protein n=1 Tax=Pseudoduganella sp. TaxID=1880898 RepID=UPI0035B19721
MRIRYWLLLIFLFCLGARAQNQDLPVANPADKVHVYIIPTDGIAEQAAGRMARGVSAETGLTVRSTLWAPSGKLEPFAGTGQYAAEDLMALSARIAPTLHDVSPNTYYIVLTNRDINSSDRTFRFLFAHHNPAANTSVLSIARLLHNRNGTAASPEVAGMRIGKMLVRTVGEVRMGWKRTGDQKDVMYAPIMSTDDIDRMDLAGSVRARRQGAQQ